GRDIVSAGLVESVEARGGLVHAALLTDRTRAPSMEPVRRAAEAALAAVPGVNNAAVVLTAHKPASTSAPPPPPRPGAAPPHRPRGAGAERPHLLADVGAVIAVAS